MADNHLFNISESLREDTSNLFLNQPPQHLGDSCCEEEVDDSKDEPLHYPNETFINKLKSTYKQTRSVQIESLSTLSTEGMRFLIESLISENLQFRSHKEGRKSWNSSDSESENYKGSNFSNNSLYKQPTFPTFRPVANDELKIRRNNNISTYQKIEAICTSQESYSVIPISVKLPQPEQHDHTVLKLVQEISDAKNTKNMLFQVIRLSPSKLKIVSQVSQILKTLAKRKQIFSGLLQESAKIKIFSQLLTLKKKKQKKQIVNFTDDEVLVLKSIFEVFDSQNLRNFRGYAYGLMKEHEASEITKILIKHASWMEMSHFGEMLMQVACLKQVLEHQEGVLKEVKDLNLRRIEEIKELQRVVKGLA